MPEPSMRRDDLFSLEGRTALVTGGSRGIGAMVAEGFVANGARVYIAARTSEDVTATAQRLDAAYDGECIPLVADLGSQRGIEELAAEVASREQALHVLVNNAGTDAVAKFAEFTERQWDDVLDLNLKAAFFLTQHLLALLTAHATEDRRSAVINMSSITATKTGARGDYSYRASKAGLNQLTRMLAKDLARDHVNVNAISPGFFRSSLTEFVFESDDLYQRVTRRMPIPRDGRPFEIAGLALYLASPAGGYMTGAILEIDGGLRFID